MQGKEGNGQSLCSVYYAVDFEARCVCVFASRRVARQRGEDENGLALKGDSVLLWKHVTHMK